MVVLNGVRNKTITSALNCALSLRARNLPKSTVNVNTACGPIPVIAQPDQQVARTLGMEREHLSPGNKTPLLFVHIVVDCAANNATFVCVERWVLSPSRRCLLRMVQTVPFFLGA